MIRYFTTPLIEKTASSLVSDKIHGKNIGLGEADGKICSYTNKAITW